MQKEILFFNGMKILFSSKKQRLWEIDFFRGIAILMMISYHIIFDLDFFGIYDFDINSGTLFWYARAIAGSFIFLVGISLSLSYSKAKNDKDVFLKNIKRGLWIFSLGVLITFATWIFLKEGFVVFGILHFIGIAIIFSSLFLKFKKLNLLFGIVFIFIGIFLQSFRFDFNYLLPFGFAPKNFYTVDYVPFFPWFGVVLIGIFIGNVFYKEKQLQKMESEIAMKNYKDLKFQYKSKNEKFYNNYFIKLICFFGRHSLLIYLIHQPIIISLIYVFIL